MLRVNTSFEEHEENCQKALKDDAFQTTQLKLYVALSGSEGWTTPIQDTIGASIRKDI